MSRFRTRTKRAALRTVAVAFVAVIVLDQAGCEPRPDVLIGAGDIAECDKTGDSFTARLVTDISGEVITFGDLAYEDGTAREFRDCYLPTWGRHDWRVHPSPGNHEYHTPGADGYFDYFGRRAGPDRRGIYHFDKGGWRIFSLNSEANIAAGAAYVRANAGGKRCIAAYWHKPLRSSGKHGSTDAVAPLWQALYDVGGDLVLNGHDHDYERFAELGRTGLPQAGGMRQIIVGTGGSGHYAFNAPLPGSQVRNSTSFGVIVVSLHARSYSWRFRPIAGHTFTDSGTGTC